jgi:hypothetical protein
LPFSGYVQLLMLISVKPDSKSWKARRHIHVSTALDVSSLIAYFDHHKLLAQFGDPTRNFSLRVSGVRMIHVIVNNIMVTKVCSKRYQCICSMRWLSALSNYRCEVPRFASAPAEAHPVRFRAPPGSAAHMV